MTETGSEPSPDDAALIEELVFRCLESGDAPATARALCLEHPSAAPRLRRVLARLEIEGFGADSRATAGAPRGAGSELTIPEELGDFRMVSCLGAGGMGVVYLADDRKLGRQVAVKIVRPEQLFFAGARERFQREIEAIARLQHPGIVRIHSVGEENGVPFFAMEYVRGISLARLIAGLTGTNPARLRGRDVDSHLGSDSQDASSADGTWNRMVVHIVRDVADALEHAHAQGVLHRDVKPSNILIGDDRRPRLLDFGLARTADAQDLTRSNAHLGSLPYMAPEQLAEAPVVPAPALDVYALGVTMYELLALRSPFLGGTAEETRANILAASPAPPRTHNASISVDLETVCLTAMDPNPARRYPTMAAFRADLENLIAHRPIVARPVGRGLRTWRWCQRHPTATVGLAMGVLLLASVLLFAVQQRRHAVATEEASYILGLLAADSQITESRIAEARESLAMCPERLRRFEWHYLDGLSQAADAEYIGHDDRARWVDIRPGGEEFVSAGEDGTLRFWRFDAPAPIRTVRVPSRFPPVNVHCCRYAADGESVFASDSSGKLRRWPRDGSAPIDLHPMPQGITTRIAVDPSGAFVACGMRQGRVELIDARSGALLHALEIAGSDPKFGRFAIQALEFSADGRWLYAAHVKQVAVFDLRDRTQVKLLEHDSLVAALCPTPDGTRLLAGTSSGMLHVWSLPDYAHAAAEHSSWSLAINAVVAADDSGRILCAGVRGPIAVFDAKSLRRTGALLGHGGTVTRMVLAADGRTLLTSSHDGTIRRWRADTVQATQVVGQHRGLVRSLAVAPAGFALTSGKDGRLARWDLDRRQGSDVASFGPRGVRAMSLSPDGSRVLVALDPASHRLDGPTVRDGFRVLDLASGASRRIALPAPPALVAWLPDGERCVATRPNAPLWLIDVERGEVTGEMAIPAGAPGAFVAKLVVVPWSGQVVTGLANGRILIWDTRTLRIEREVPTTGGQVGALCIDPVRRVVIAADLQGRIRFFDPGSGEAVRADVEWRDEVISVIASSPDGERMITGTMGGVIQVWDRRRMRRLLRLRGHSLGVMDAAFTPDGTRVVSVSMDGTVRVWDARPR